MTADPVSEPTITPCACAEPECEYTPCNACIAEACSHFTTTEEDDDR